MAHDDAAHPRVPDVTRALPGGDGGSTRYRPEGEVARGGMGAVLRVYDADLRRVLAMKVMLDSGADSPELARFLAEAQITGQLDHPGVVPIHDVGIDAAGHVYFTMKLVKGRDLRAVFDLARDEREGWDRTRAVGVLQRVCEAMAYAHDKGVVHRDLKPANVMVGEYGEVYVMDWGLARVDGDEAVRTERTEAQREDSDSPLATLEGTVLGTPSYMAPEQARGEVDSLGPHSDVYAVGAMLYHLLTNRMPYALPGSSSRDVLAMVRAGPPRPVHELAPDAPPELESIRARAMARDPKRRYRDMGELGDDLRAYLHGRVVRAHKTGAVVELRKWISRNKAIAALTAAVVLVTVGGLSGTTWVQAHERRRAERSAYVGNITAAWMALDARDTLEARLRLAACPPELRGWEWGHLDLRTDTSLLVLEGHGAPVRSVEFAPDGTWLASVSEDGTARVWDVASGGCLHSLGTPSVGDGLRRLAIRPDGSRIAASGGGGVVGLWDARTGELVREARSGTGQVLALAFDPFGRWLAAGATGAVGGDMPFAVTLLDAESGDVVGELGPHTGLVLAVAFGPAGRRLVSGSRDGTVCVWDVETRACLRVLAGLRRVHAVAVAPDGELVAGADEDGRILVWRLATGELVAALDGHRKAVLGLKFQPGGALFASWSSDESVRLWNPGTGAQVHVLPHDGSVSSVAFDTTGARLVSCETSPTVRVWDVESGGLLTDLRGHDDSVLCVTYSPDGTWIASAGLDRDVRVWSAAAGDGWSELVGHTERVEALAFDSAGARIASGGYDRHARVWDAETGTCLAELRHESSVLAVAIDPGGGTVATGAGPHVRLWDVETESCRSTLRGHVLEVRAIAFDHGGERLVSGSDDATLRIWDVASGECLHQLEGHTAPVTGIAVRRDRIASGSGDGRVIVWDARSGQRLATLSTPAQDDRVRSVDLDGRAQRVVAGYEDGTVRSWSLAEAGALELSGHRHFVEGVAFSPDGARIASGSLDESLRVWDVRTGDLVATLRCAEPISSVAFSPDGKRIAAGLWGSPAAIRLWETERETASRTWRVSALEGR